MIVEPMTAEDWAAVRRIYAEGIATGDATLEREAPDWNHFDHSHPAECRLVARDAPTATSSAGRRSAATRRARSTAASRGRACTSRPTRAAGASGRALLEALIPASEAAGYWTLLAGVIADNAASLALHERVGFRRIGVQRALGQDAAGRWRDVVVLERRSTTVGV